MRRAVIDLSRDLPSRALPLSERALAGVFGGYGPCSQEGGFCGSFTYCCQGLSCQTFSVMGMSGGMCKKA